MPVSPEDFRSTLSRFASGVTVVTGRDASGVPFGMTVSSFCSVSLEPPLVLVCIQKTVNCHKGLSESEAFAVNVLSVSQDGVSNTFASHSADKFSGVAFRDGELGSPLIDGSIATLECSKFKEIDAGDHTIFIGTVEKSSVGDEFPLVYWRGAYRDLKDE